jgi:hypothetical protein
MMKQNPDLGRSDVRLVRTSQTVAEPWSGGPLGVDTRLQNHSIVIERKHVTFDLRENSRGRFLRIIEEVSGRQNAIIIPLTGIETFRDALCEVIKFSKTLSPEA